MGAQVGALKKGHLHLKVGNGRGAFFLQEALPGGLRTDLPSVVGPHLLP